MRIAVTGAHGFVGSHVVSEALGSGHEVIAVVSPWGDGSWLTERAHGGSCRVRRADVTDPASLAGAFDGCDAVVHAAARVRDHGPWPAFHRVNVAGTAHVVDEATRAGAARVVLVSSVAIWRYLGIRGDDPRTRPRDQHLLPYGRSKLLAEDVVRDRAAEPVIVRPALWPYGRRDPNLARVAGALRRGLLPLVDGGRARLQTVDVGALARVLVVACDHPAAAGRAYLVADEGTPSWRELFTEMAELLGVAPPRWSLPGGPVERAAPFVEGAWRALAGTAEPPLTRYRAALMRRDVVFEAGAVEDELGVRPRRGRREALQDALDDAVGAGRDASRDPAPDAGALAGGRDEERPEPPPEARS